MDRLAACTAALVVFLRRWRKIWTIFQPLGRKGRYLKKSPKPCWPIRSKETWTKCTPTTLISQRKLALTARKCPFCVKKSFKQLKNVKTGRVPYLGLELTIMSSNAKSISWDSPFKVQIMDAQFKSRTSYTLYIYSGRGKSMPRGKFMPQHLYKLF